MKSLFAIISLTVLASLQGIEGKQVEGSFFQDRKYKQQLFPPKGCGLIDLDGNLLTLPIVITAEETTGPDLILYRFRSLGVTDITTAPNPFNKYTQLVWSNDNSFYFIGTPADGNFADFVTVERSIQMNRTEVLACEGGADGTSSNEVTFVINVPDVNNKAPEFDQEGYSAVFHLPPEPEFSLGVLDLNMTITDKDLEPGNANVRISSNSYFIFGLTTKIDNPQAHTYEVEVFVENSIEPGEYVALITADDGIHSSSVNVTVKAIQAVPTPITELPTETADTEDTPVTLTTTTERPVYNCGLVGLDPTNVVTLEEDLNPFLPTGTEIWRSTMFNVIYTAAMVNPHNQYIDALRQGTSYWFRTTAAYPDFLVEQAPATAITRTVNFYCADDSIVRYYFSLPIETGARKVRSNLQY